ncbi:MAG TPA: Lpg1974 family pore-forming outer membrane protein [Gemmataceae bacterium]|jgi:hypothetical protein
MTHGLRGLLILAGLVGMLWPSAGFSQSTPPADSATETLPTPSRVPSTPPPPPLNLPPAGMLPGSPNLPPPPPLIGDGPASENGVLGPPGQTIGWFGTVEIGLIDPHVNSHLNSGSNIKAPFLTPSTPTGSVQTPLPPGSNADVIRIFGDHITLPMAPLNWTGAPRLRLGYRFADGAGDVRLEWRMAASQGSDTTPNFDAGGAGLLRSRLNVQQINFTYGTSEFLTNAPQINRTWAARIGVSAANVFFDSRAQGQQILDQSASSSFAGVGPTLAFLFHKPLAQSRVSLYGEVDATGLAGWTRQHFSETVAGDFGTTFTDSVALRRQSNGVGILGVEGGFSYAPWDDRCWRFTLGYQWQRWWWVGATSDSNADLTLQGIFFRGEWRY